MARGANKQKVVLWGRKADGNLGEISVSDDGKMQVATPPAEAPANTTPVSQIAQSDMTGTVDLNYVIPSGVTLRLQRFIGGAEGNGTASKVEIFYDPAGNGTGMTLIAVGYVADSNFQFDLSESFVGNGTRKIKMRRTRLDAGTREVFGKWSGYY